MCFRDGGNHSQTDACPEMDVPEGMGRCFNCFLPQEDLAGLSFHTLGKQEQQSHCKAMKTRQYRLLLWFLRSRTLRDTFFGSSQPYVSRVPAWHGKPGLSLTHMEVREYFAWLWTPSPIGRSIFNIDAVLRFLYMTIVVKSAKAR